MEINNIKTPEDIFLWMDENISMAGLIRKAAGMWDIRSM